MNPFAPLPDRDAYATIRGFVYQADLTILRWLDLKSGQALELEAGEDIDLVADALNTSPFPIERLLEQVKHREMNVTLRSSSVLEAISNAIEQREKNTGHNLLFRFSTTAQVGQEKAIEVGKPLPFPMLELWEKLRRNETMALSRSDAAALLKRFVISLKMPKDFGEKAWERISSFFKTKTESEILELVGVLEWSTGGRPAADLQQDIEARLIALGLATEATHATQLYERLFLFVFKLLTQKGLKTLTPEELEAQKNLPVLAHADHELLHRVKERIELLTLRVHQLEFAMAAAMNRIAAQEQITSHPEFNLSPRLDPPALADPLAPRTALVDGIVSAFSSARWVSLTGGVSDGKTTFALLLAQRLGGDCNWVRLSEGDDRVLTAVLERSLAAINGSAPTPNRSEWLKQVCAAAGQGSTLVIDQVPDLVARPGLAELLRSVATACRDNDVYLITVSAHPLPAGVTSAVPAASLKEVAVPPFGYAETTELLSAYGAPEGFTSTGRIHFLTLLGRGHPVLLGAIAKFLAANGWGFNEESLTALLEGAHAQDISDEVVRRLIGTVSERARQLLYRLSLAWTTVSRAEIDAVGDVAPPVPNRNEAILEVLGPWVLRADAAHFVLSPLVRRIGPAALDTPVKGACHAALGEALLRRSSIGMTESLEVISHFDSAGQSDRAGFLFLMCLRAVHETGDLEVGEPLISLWDHRRMPLGMSPAIRMLGRAYQLVLRAERGLSSDQVLEDLLSLFDEAQAADRWAVPLAAAFASIGLSASDTMSAQKLAQIAAASWGDLKGPDGEVVEPPAEIVPEHLLWGTIPHASPISF
jgi:hypothetical protein